jgi:hypothetical protein
MPLWSKQAASTEGLEQDRSCISRQMLHRSIPPGYRQNLAVAKEAPVASSCVDALREEQLITPIWTGSDMVEKVPR